jgi:ABC-type glycerol-3-phosphate transport system substrate-binding protein
MPTRGTAVDAKALSHLRLLPLKSVSVFRQFDNLPSRSDSKDSPFWKNDPVWRGTFLDTVSAGHSMPSIPFGPALKLTMDGVQQVLYKKASPDQAAQDFFTGVKNYLDTSVNK